MKKFLKKGHKSDTFFSNEKKKVTHDVLWKARIYKDLFLYINKR